MESMNRRAFLALPVLGVGGLAAAKVAGRWWVGAAETPLPLPALTHLSARQARIVTAAAMAMVGPEAAAAVESGQWVPAADVDGLLGRLAADQRAQVGLGLHVLEEWTWGWSGFSSWDIDTRRAVLARWRTSDLAVQRSVWGFLHAACCSAWAGSALGWQQVGYPGPCVGPTPRAPGQTALFEWDEAVP